MLVLFYHVTVNLEKCVFYCEYFICSVSCTVVVLTSSVICGVINVWVCEYVWVFYVVLCICGLCNVNCFDKCVGVLVICVFVFTLFCIVLLCFCIFPFMLIYSYLLLV